MSNKSRRLQFEEAAPVGAIRLLSDSIDATALAEGNRTVKVTLARVMTFNDPFYGKVRLTHNLFAQMIKNFNAKTLGQDIFIDVSHRPSDGAAATFEKVFMEGKKFKAEVSFTEYGIEAITKRSMKYLSIDFTEEYTDSETMKEHGALLFGAGLTIRPRVKHLDPVTLSFEDDEQPMLLDLGAKHQLTEETEKIMKKQLKILLAALAALSLSDNVVSQYQENFEATAKALGDNEEAMEAVANGFIATAKQLAESGQGNNESIKLDFSSLKIEPGATGLNMDDVRKVLAEDAEKRLAAETKLTADRKANVDLFNKKLDEAEGLKDLPEDQRKQLGEVADMITAEMTEDQITRLADNQIAMANQMTVNTKLGSMGFNGPNGSVRISMDETNSTKEL